MRRAGKFLSVVGLGVGILTGVSLLLPVGTFGLSFLAAVGLVKLAFLSAIGLIAGGAIVQRMAQRIAARDRPLSRGTEWFRVRRATVADATAVADFAERTFVETFGAVNTPENMALHVSKSYGVAQQARELADPDCVFILFEDHATIAAYAEVRRAEAPPCVTGDRPVELHRFYVDGPWHGSAVARLLMEEAMRVAREFGARTLWLGVWERNARAIAFYTKCGFRMAGATEFSLGAELQSDRIMVTALAPAAASA